MLRVTLSEKSPFDFAHCFLSEGGQSTTWWLTQLWQWNMCRKVSRHMICHWQQQVSYRSSPFLPSTLNCFFYFLVSFISLPYLLCSSLLVSLPPLVTLLVSSLPLSSWKFILNLFCLPEWLPLYGNMCCRLVAQPLCMIQPVISGQLEVKVTRFSYLFPSLVFFSLTHSIGSITLLSALSFSLERTSIAGRMSTASSGDKVCSAMRVKKTWSPRTSHYL